MHRQQRRPEHGVLHRVGIASGCRRDAPCCDQSVTHSPVPLRQWTSAVVSTGRESDSSERPAVRRSRRDRVRLIIFESETRAGRTFDVLLIFAILVSVAAVLLESVPAANARFGDALRVVEWGFTIAFTIEYGVRLWCIEQPRLYARSFYGIVDLLGILPTYLSLLFVDTQYVTVVRILRVLRVFRVLRMGRWVSEASLLWRRCSRHGEKCLSSLRRPDPGRGF